jgi:peptide deformylase
MSVREVVAIAANQVGEPLRLAIVEAEEGNPRYPYKPRNRSR